MEADSMLAAAPRRVGVGTERAETSYEVSEDLIAVHGGGPRPGAILVLEGGEVAVEPLDGNPPAECEGMLGPVYRRMPSGGVAVPTGRVFVRFVEGERAEDHRPELEASGYRLEEVPGYAPHAAWIRHSSGDIAAALRDLDRLEHVRALAGVEPQFLTEAAGRMSGIPIHRRGFRS